MMHTGRWTIRTWFMKFRSYAICPAASEVMAESDSDPQAEFAMRGIKNLCPTGNTFRSLAQGSVFRFAICLYYFVLFTFNFSSFAREGRTCGVDALYQICLLYNRSVPYEKVYEACKPTDKGNSMLDLYRAAEELGFTAEGVRLSYAEFLKRGTPGIAFVNGTHFVAVLGVQDGQVRVLDYPEPGVRHERVAKRLKRRDSQ